MKVYSQNDEQRVILNYFKGKPGVFADIGANDGITFSNTRALVEMGWQGIFVEPSPKAFDKLTKNYDGLPGVYFYNFAITSHNGNVILHESGPLVGKDDVALVSSCYAHETERFKRVVSYDPVTVKCFTWKTFLNRVKFKSFDFISIDAEGYDKEILSQIDLSNTKMVCVEWNGNSTLHYEYDKLCTGMRVIYKSGENLIYAR